MATKLDAEHVVNFALSPVGARPNINYRREVFIFPNARFETKARVVREGLQVVDDLKAKLSAFIRRGNVRQKSVVGSLANFKMEVSASLRT